MHMVLREKLDQFVTVYLDDILVFSASAEEHARHLRWVFEQLRKHALKAKRRKCMFACSQLEYLGHLVTKDGVKVDPSKTEAINNMPAPTNKRELQVFLGMCNYYSRFVLGYAQVASPLYALLRKSVDWNWQAPQQAAFQALKQALSAAPVLRIPRFDAEFVVETDASNVAIGGVLQ